MVTGSSIRQGIAMAPRSELRCSWIAAMMGLKNLPEMMLWWGYIIYNIIYIYIIIYIYTLYYIHIYIYVYNIMYIYIICVYIYIINIIYIYIHNTCVYIYIYMCVSGYPYTSLGVCGFADQRSCLLWVPFMFVQLVAIVSIVYLGPSPNTNRHSKPLLYSICKAKRYIGGFLSSWGTH